MDEKNGTVTWVDPATLESVVADTWDTYLGATATPVDTESAAPGEPVTPGGDAGIEARIRISGDTVWEMALFGSLASAQEATRRMLGSSDHVADAGAPECVLDAWGELVNTLAGNLKASLQCGAYTLSMPQASVERMSPTPTRESGEFSFTWDGHLAVIRIGRVTSV